MRRSRSSSAYSCVGRWGTSAVLGKGHLPVALERDPAIPDEHGVAGRQLLDPPEERPRRERAPEREDLVQSHRIGGRGHAGAGEDRLDLGAEDQGAVGLRVEEGADAQPIAGQEQGAVPAVPDGDRELAVEAGQAVRAVLLVRVQDDFGVARGREPVSPALQLQSQLRVIEDLTVEHDPQGPIFVGDGLLAGAQVDDAQARIPEADVIVEVDPELVGPAVADRPEHRAEGGFLRRPSPAEVADSDDAAHLARLRCLFASASRPCLSAKPNRPSR